MTIKSIECADCGAPVPYGRLACPSCGALLAAVAGGPPPAVRVVETPAPDAADTARANAAPAPKPRSRSTARTTPKEPVTREHAGKAAAPVNGSTKLSAPPGSTPAPPGAGAAPKAARAAAPAPATPPAPVTSAPVARSSTRSAPVEQSSTSSAPVAAQLAYLVEPSPDAPQYVIPAPPVAASTAVDRMGPAPARATNGRSPVATADTPTRGRTTYLEPEPPIRGSSGYVIDDPYAEADDDEAPASPWPPLLQPEPTILARPYGGPSNSTDGTPRPGAYLPPNISAGAAPAATTATPTTGGPLPAGALAAGAAGGAAAAVAAKSSPRFDPVATLNTAFAGIDRPRVAEIAGWFVVAGSSMALLGFLLPWSVVVIGSRGTGGYLDDWGLASPTHLFAVLGLAGVLALGVLRNKVPVWLRTGVLGLLTGGLLVGLTWPYAIGPLGADIGAMATFIGGLVLLGGGFVAIWATRHAEANPVV
jgi:hypothetical protein